MLLTSALQVFIQSNLNYCLRLCLVRVKPFPERKTFSCVWLSQNSFYGKLILVFGSFKHFTRKCIKSGKTLVRRAARSTITITPLVGRAPLVNRRAMRLSDDRDRAPRHSSARCDRRTSGAIWALSLWSGLSLLSLSLSLFFRKWFEVKMRGENDFRVKGENIGQPEVIFRKMIFSVTAKHSGFMENDFRKQFSPNSNTP